MGSFKEIDSRLFRLDIKIQLIPSYYRSFWRIFPSHFALPLLINSSFPSKKCVRNNVRERNQKSFCSENKSQVFSNFLAVIVVTLQNEGFPAGRPDGELQECSKRLTSRLSRDTLQPNVVVILNVKKTRFGSGRTKISAILQC